MLWVSLPFATFGLAIAEGVVIATPPIARYAKGWPEARVWSYFEGRGATVEVAVPRQL